MVITNTTPGQSLLSKLIAAINRDDPALSVPYQPDDEAQEFWRGCTPDAQAAPGQPIPKELEPPEPCPSDDTAPEKSS